MTPSIEIEKGEKGEKGFMRVQLTRSVAHRLASHKACVRGLGLCRMHQIITVEDTPATRGMVNKVSYMVKVLEISSGD
jgi:large subunit ribosomal protein L30